MFVAGLRTDVVRGRSSCTWYGRLATHLPTPVPPIATASPLQDTVACHREPLVCCTFRTILSRPLLVFTPFTCLGGFKPRLLSICTASPTHTLQATVSVVHASGPLHPAGNSAPPPLRVRRHAPPACFTPGEAHATPYLHQHTHTIPTRLPTGAPIWCFVRKGPVFTPPAHPPHRQPYTYRRTHLTPLQEGPMPRLPCSSTPTPPMSSKGASIWCISRRVPCHASSPPTHPRQPTTLSTTGLQPSLASACNRSRRGNTTPLLHRHTHANLSLYQNPTVYHRSPRLEAPPEGHAVPRHFTGTPRNSLLRRLNSNAIDPQIYTYLYILLTRPIASTPVLQPLPDPSPSRFLVHLLPSWLTLI